MRHRRGEDRDVLTQILAAVRVGTPATRSAGHAYTATATGASPTINLETTYGRPMDRFALQVTGTNTQVGVTTWTATVQVSLNGTTFTDLFSHAYPATADGATVWAADAILRPAYYLRINVSALVLGTATNIIAIVLPMP